MTTFVNQALLPRLPVPPLQATCDKLLCALLPLCRTAAERERAAELVRELREMAPRAQALLEARAAAVPNWLEQWWERYAYFSGRGSIAPIEGMTMTEDPLGRALTQTQRAATLLAAIAAFKEGLDLGTVPPDRATKANTPLCMEQYRRIFCSCRIPGHPEDGSRRLFGTAAGTAASHVVVAARSTFWRLELRTVTVGEVGGRWLREEEIELQLRRILVDAESVRSAENAAAGSVGWLTGGEREPWAEARLMLAQASPDNRSSLDAIEGALLVVCLDEKQGKGAAHSMHEVQIAEESGNRWYDKATQLVVFADGVAGVTMEHSGTDGQAVLGMWRAVQARILAGGAAPRWHSAIGGDTSAATKAEELPPPQPLRWVVPPGVHRAIATAADAVKAERAAHVLHVMNFRAFGTVAIKRDLSVSPDAFCQLAMMLAHYRQHRRLVAVYESVSMLSYRGGRTETGRPLTSATRQLLWAMVGAEVGQERGKAAETAEAASALAPGDLAVLARAAAKSISENVAEALQGAGIDRHLFGLRMAGSEAGLPVPLLFEDPLFARFNTFELSTSNLPTPGLARSVAFRLPTPETTGVLYQLYEDALTLTVITSERCTGTNGAAYCALLERSCHDLYAVLLPEASSAVLGPPAVIDHASASSSASAPFSKL